MIVIDKHKVAVFQFDDVDGRVWVSKLRLVGVAPMMPPVVRFRAEDVAARIRPIPTAAPHVADQIVGG